MAKAGTLRHRVVFQSPSTTVDTYGDAQSSWANTATVWARVNSLSGRERETLDRVTAEVSHKIRYRTKAVTVTPGMRVLFKGQTLNVEWVEAMDFREIESVAYVSGEISP